MGWTSTGDPYSHGESALGIESEEEAKAFAERHGWDYPVKKRHTPLLKITISGRVILKHRPTDNL